ncbi:hypothetical protein ABPG75_003928 [Micractinium tetrahymenae]
MPTSSSEEEAVSAAADLESLLLQAEAPRVLDALERGSPPAGTGAGASPPAPPPLPVPSDRVAAARGAYAQLQHAALRAVSDLAALQQRLAGLLVQVQAVRLQAQWEERGFTDPIQLLDQVREDRDRAGREAAAAADSEEAAQRQGEALAQRLAHLNTKLAEAEDERRAELAPELKAARDNVALLQGQLEAECARAGAAQREAADVAAKLEALQQEVGALRAALEEEREALTSSDLQPSRARHLADLAVAQLRGLREEEAELAAQLKACDAVEEGQLQESQQLVQQQAAAVKANDKLSNAVAMRERAADEVARDIEMAKVEAERLLAEQVTWDLEVEKKEGEAKREAEAVKAEQRGRDVTQRRLNRAEREAKQLQEQLPGLRNTVHNLAGQLAADQREAAAAAQAARALQTEVEGTVESVVAERKMTEVQSSLVKASLADVKQLDEESAALRAAVEERDKAILAATSQRDQAVRFLNQRLHRLAELIDEAEVKDGEMEELHKKRREVKSGHADLRDLCSLMSGQMGRFKGLLEYARKGADDLADRVAAAEEELAQVKRRADSRAHDVRQEERTRAASQADKALLAGQLAAARRRAAAVAEAADGVEIEHALLGRGAAEAGEGMDQLAARRAAAQAAKAASQVALLERNEEMVGLFERSAALQQELDDGTVALQRCDDDMRLLQLEVAELQRKLSATHKTAPDVVSYDRQIAALKADVLRARKEAETLGAALESPKESMERWRVLPGKLPSRDELAARIATIEERLAARKDLAVQKDSVLEELERLTEGLVEKARASHDPALGLAVQMNEARRQQQQLTRRMMATVSELSLHQALSLKSATDRDSIAAELAQAKKNMAAGRPPTAGADMEFDRQERDRAAEAEVRAQAAELRRLKADGLLGTLRSTASPRPQAYIPEDLGVPKPFPAAFKPFKPSDPPAAVTAALQRTAPPPAVEDAVAAAAVQQQQHFGVQASPVTPLASRGASPVPTALAAVCAT